MQQSIDLCWKYLFSFQPRKVAFPLGCARATRFPVVDIMKNTACGDDVSMRSTHALSSARTRPLTSGVVYALLLFPNIHRTEYVRSCCISGHLLLPSMRRESVELLMRDKMFANRILDVNHCFFVLMRGETNRRMASWSCWQDTVSCRSLVIEISKEDK